jgi:amino acid transporter
LDSIFIVIGSIIGVGIFATPGIALSLIAVDGAGAGAVLTIWSVAGMIAMLQSICYGELGACITSAGGQYAWLKLGFGDAIACMYQVQNVFLSLASVGAGAVIFAEYFLGAVYPCDSHIITPWLVKSVALTLTALLTGVNLLGVEAGTYIR